MQKAKIDEKAIAHSLKVLENVKSLGSEGIPDFEWPMTTNEQKRINSISRDLKDKSLAESFAAVYGVREVFGKKSNVERLQSITCRELNPGDIVELRVKDITKKGVIFEQDTYKETIISTINLYQYPNFKNFIPKNPLKVKVLSKNLDKVYVDPFQPMLDEFIDGIKARIAEQANVKKPLITKVKNLQHIRTGYTGNLRIDNISDFCGKDVYMQAFIPGSQIALNIEKDFEKWSGKDVDTFVTNLAIKPGTTNVTVACSVKEYLKFLGNIESIQLFKDYTENNATWKECISKKFEGVITGICNTRNKSGVFVEIPSMNITGMVSVPREELTQYHPGKCKVKILGFDELMKYNRDADQMQHVEPYVIDSDVLKKVNLKCQLEFVK